MNNKHAVFTAVLFLCVAGLFSDSASVEYVYSCPCCKERFLAFYVSSGKAEDDENSKEALPLGPSVQFILPTIDGAERDSDMCHVYEGTNKYALSIITCPYCGFSFIHDHYRMRIPQKVKDLILGELKPRMTSFKNGYTRMMRDRGAEKFKINAFNFQSHIPIDMKYNNAIRCYEWLGFSNGFISKIAIYGAWAYRSEVCRPFSMVESKAFNKALKKIDKRLEKHAKELIEIDRKTPGLKTEKMKELLEGILSEERLSEMETGVISMMLVGICDRLGIYHDTEKYLGKARLASEKEKKFGLYLEKVAQWLKSEREFLKTALNKKKKEFSAFNYPRPELLSESYLVAEFHKRTGNLESAYLWLSVLAGLEDSPPHLKTVAGTRMNEVAEMMKAAGNPGTLAPDDRLLAEDVKNGLGTVDFYIKKGLVKTGLKPGTCREVMKKIGYAIIIFNDEKGYYPDDFQQLWDGKYIPNPAAVNFFCCPVTGKKYSYHIPKTGFLVWPFLVDPEAHAWSTEEKFFGVFSSNGFFNLEKTVPAEVKK